MSPAERARPTTLRPRRPAIGPSAQGLNRVGSGRYTHVADLGLAWPVVAAHHRQQLGMRGEQLAAEHLIRRGFEILERNYRTRWGELDIVAFDGRTLAFCEVKTRRIAEGGGTPFEAMHGRKRGRVRKMAGSWMSERAGRPFAAVIRCDA